MSQSVAQDSRLSINFMELKIAFVGFGNVAREFARLLESRREILSRDYGLRWQITGIATGHHGCVVARSGIDLTETWQRVEAHESLVGMPETSAVGDAMALIQTCGADVLFETTPLSPTDGEPAASYIREAFARGIHVVTANKGPIACAYQELNATAKTCGRRFRFEGTVMDGTPVFNLMEYCLPGTRVLGFAGVLNSTTNLILAAMGGGRSFDDGGEEARKLGIAEANADYDIDGRDAAVKAVALANVLMGANLHPREVRPEGIRKVTPEDVKRARLRGTAIRLVARAEPAAQHVSIRVAPEAVPLDSLFANLQGTSNALTLKTDLMGELTIVEHDPGVTQTAYALLSDFLRIHEDLRVKERRL